MMRLTLPLPDFSNWFGSIPQGLTWLLIGKGFDYLLKNRKIFFKPRNFRKNFGWFRIACLVLCFVSSYKIGILFEKLRLKKMVTYTDKVNMSILKIGFKILKKIEPQLAFFIYERLEKIVTAIKIGDITGVYNYDEVLKI